MDKERIEKIYSKFPIFRPKFSFGFTLIELLVVAVIISVLTGIAVINYSSAQRKARDGKRRADLEAVRGALEMRRADFGDYPETGEFPGWGVPWSETFGGNTYTYMQQTPTDPKSPTYNYSYVSNGSTYALCAYLESGGGSITGCGSCGTGVTCNYKVVQP